MQTVALSLLLPVDPADLTPVALTRGAVPATTPRPPNLSDAEVEEIRANVSASDAEHTKRAYRTAWATFTAFCEARGATALPALPETLAAYLSLALRVDGQPYTVGSLNLHLSAIKRAHRERGLVPPHDHALVYRVWKGIRRRRGTWQEGAAPMTADLLRRAAAALPAPPRGLRDRVILLLGFLAAARRSELAAVTLADVAVLPEGGYAVRLTRRKTGDVEEIIGLAPGRPATEALEAWIEHLAGDAAIPLTPDAPLLGVKPAAIRVAVRRAARAAGLDPDAFSAHSLRAGAATSAAEAGLDLSAIRTLGGWRSVVTADRYVRRRRDGADSPRARLDATLTPPQPAFGSGEPP